MQRRSGDGGETWENGKNLIISSGGFGIVEPQMKNTDINTMLNHNIPPNNRSEKIEIFQILNLLTFLMS